MSVATFFNLTPAPSVPPRERPALPASADALPERRTFNEALDQSPARAERKLADESRTQPPAAEGREAAAEQAETTTEDSVATTESETGEVVVRDAEALAEQPADDSEPVIVSAELFGTTLQVQIALPDGVAEVDQGLAEGESALGGAGVAALPAWLDPFSNQAGLLTISLNNQPLFNGLIEGVAAVLPTLTGLAANANAQGNLLTPITPGTSTGLPILPAGETAAQGGTADGGDSNSAGSTFTSTASNANAAANLNFPGNSPAAFTLPLAAETPTGVNTLLNNDAGAARTTANGNTGATLSTAFNPAGLTQAESSNDALNSARLTRGLNAAVNQQGGNITLRLTPPELGTVRIQLNLQGGNVSAQFHAETDSARTLLTQQLGQLRTSLESQGLNVERLGVQGLNSSSNSSSLQQQQSNQSQTQAEADGRSRGGQQQQPGNSNSESQEERARDNLAAARDLFTDLIDSPGTTPGLIPGTTPEAA